MPEPTQPPAHMVHVNVPDDYLAPVRNRACECFFAGFDKRPPIGKGEPFALVHRGQVFGMARLENLEMTARGWRLWWRSDSFEQVN